MARISTGVGTAVAAVVLVAAPFFGAAGLEPLSGPSAAAVPVISAASGAGSELGVVIRMIDGVVPETERADRRGRAAVASVGAPVDASSAPVCASMPGGGPAGAPGLSSPLGVDGTTTSDLARFAQAYNEIRVANCLPPIPFSNIRYDSCMEERLFWMAEDPSTDPLSAWGHDGSQRSDGVPSVGCDGNLAGGVGDTGASVAQKWWDSGSHRASLYKPGASIAGACILFSMTHGGLPEESDGLVRAAARWTSC